MKRVLSMLAALMLLSAWQAHADPAIDYKPGKGVWRVEVVKVNPNKIRAYVTELTKTEIPALEVLKHHGIIDRYFVMVKANSGDYDRGNVMLGRHYTSFAAMSPQVEEAPAIIAQIKRVVAADVNAKALAAYQGYRTFYTDDMWVPLEFDLPGKNPQKR